MYEYNNIHRYLKQYAYSQWVYSKADVS